MRANVPRFPSERLLAYLDEGVSPVTAEEARARASSSTRRPSPRRNPRRNSVVLSVGFALLLAIGVVAAISISGGGHRASPHKATPIPTGQGVTDYFEHVTAPVVAGHTGVIYLVVENPGKTVNIPQADFPQGCNTPFLQVILQKGPLIVAPANAGTSCVGGPPFVIKPGAHRFPITVAASYDVCSQSPPFSINLPKCLPPARMPALPVGTYKVTLVWLRSTMKPLPDPRPIYLTVVK
jgi:hypothetical protein